MSAEAAGAMSLAERFEAERDRLRGIAYRMLGTPDDADDVVQDAWLRFAAAHDDPSPTPIDNVAAWLTTVTTRLAIDRLRSAQQRREAYVGPWLSDPVLELESPDPSPDDSVVLAESLTLGFMSVLERLSPLERAVFILGDLFQFPLTEVAAIVERSPDATRQLAKRARDHVADGRPRFAPEPDEIEELTGMVFAAALEGDVETLKTYLAADVVHISDGGRDHRAARKPVIGDDRVARLFVNLAKRMQPGMETHVVRANRQTALYSTLHGEPFMLHTVNWVEGRLAGSFAVLNPEKLATFHQQWLAGGAGRPAT
jgi:RNA polymerase sigma-70 factor (ECF subfamily)